MSEYDVIVVGNGIDTPVMTGIHDKNVAVDQAEKWFEENVKGRFEGEVIVVEKVTLIEKKFVEKTPEESGKLKVGQKDISFEDFFKEERE